MRIDELAKELIDRYELHRYGSPVDLSPLEESFHLEYHDLTGTGLDGFVKPSVRLPPSPDDPAVIVIDSHLNTFDRRLVYAHEVAHACLGHQGSLRCESVVPWLDDRQEREAWHFAAQMLIAPPEYLFEWSVPLIAAQNRVPPALVDLWQSQW